MYYIPDDWIKNERNRKEIIEIFNLLDSDIVTAELIQKKDDAVKRLKEMGEDILHEKVVGREIPFGA